VDIVVPRVFAVVRAPHLPTSLRTSAVSLLATAADTDALALNAYVPDLMGAMVDLVQVESEQSVQAQPKRDSAKKSAGDGTPSDAEDVFGKRKGSGREAKTRGGSKTVKQSKNKQNDDSKEGSATPVPGAASMDMDSHPTAANSKFPPLRRSALHFLAVIVRALIARVYDAESTDTDAYNVLGVDLPGTVIKRGATVLKYVAATDVDDVVRVMAREAAELLEQLRRALIGVPE